MRKILLLTNIYPDPSLKQLNTTSVCHYFAKEWVKQGFEVRVVFNYPIYISLLHQIAKVFERQIANKFATYVSTERLEEGYYEIDGVKVARFPIFKMLPKTKYTQKNIDKQIEKIYKYLQKENYEPDCVIGHFHNPSLNVVAGLKKYYPKAKSCVVVHGKANDIAKFYKETYQKMIYAIDVWGYRSRNIKKSFECLYGEQKQSFMCYSGVPVSFLEENINYREELHHFIYVGSLIKRKYPDILIPALINSYPDKNFKLTIIGKGERGRVLLEQKKIYNLEDRVELLGHISREEVGRHLKEADCFIMASKNESFGLVYLEAIAKGCITIASKNEGMDGIIEHKRNGFLTSSGSIGELSNLITDIRKMSKIALQDISKNAEDTAKNMTDGKVAEDYITNLLDKG